MSLEGATRFCWPDENEWDRISELEDGSGRIPKEIFSEISDRFEFSPTKIIVPLGQNPDENLDPDDDFHPRFIDGEPTLETYSEFYDDPRPIYNRQYFLATELMEIYNRRLEQQRDLQILITAANHGRGVGKSTLGVRLARFLTRDMFTDHSFSVNDDATFSADEYRRLYDERPTGSVLLFDDVERELNRRRAMSSKNVDVITMLEGMRYREHTTIFITPGKSSIDRMLDQLADVWIRVEGRGEARVYRPYINEFGGEPKIGRKYLHDIYWDPLDDDEEYQRLEEMKKEAMQGNVEIERYNQEDLEKARSKAEERVRKEVKQLLAKRMADGDYTQAEIAKLMEVDQSTISRWI